MKLNRRLIHVWAGIPLKEEDMGEVRIKVRLTNAADAANLLGGLISKDQVRSTEVEAIVDTGAVRCCIPKHLAEELGVQKAATRTVKYADGRVETVDVSLPLRIELEGRVTFEDCLILGDIMLIGQTALESTDLFVDCVNGRLLPNPEHPHAVVLHVR